MLSVVYADCRICSVVYVECRKLALYAENRYAECLRKFKVDIQHNDSLHKGLKFCHFVLLLC
jgi:hypothetical protein